MSANENGAEAMDFSDLQPAADFPLEACAAGESIEAIVEVAEPALEPVETDVTESPETGTDEHGEAEIIVGTFFIGAEEFALRADRVREVVPFPEHVTPVPLASSFVQGIFSLRGEVIPVVDAAAVLGLEGGESRGRGSVAIVSSGDAHIGVVFDRTGEVTRLEPADVLPLEHEDPRGRSIVEGVLRMDQGQRFVQLLSPTVLGAMPGVPKGVPGDDLDNEVQSCSKAIVVQLGDYEIAFPVEGVLEIQPELPIGAARAYFDHCRGVVQLRGEMRAVMDFRAVLGLEQRRGTKQLLFLKLGLDCVGLEVDELVETLEYTDDSLMPMPEMPDSKVADITQGVIAIGEHRHVLLADVPGLFERFDIAEGVKAFRSTVKEEEDDAERTLEDESFFAFRVGNSTLSFPLDDVSEVCEFPRELVLGDSRDGTVCGMMNLRGALVPLIDIIADQRETGAARGGQSVVIVDAGGPRRGLVVDNVESIIRGRTKRVGGASAISGGKTRGLSQYVKTAVLVNTGGDSSNMLLVLDPDRLLAS